MAFFYGAFTTVFTECTASYPDFRWKRKVQRLHARGCTDYTDCSCFIMSGIPLQQEQEALAFLQKTPSADGGSFYDHVTDVVLKVLGTLYTRAYA